MSENRQDDFPLPHEQRTLKINGRLYHTATGNLCPQCEAEKRTLFIKIKIADGNQVVLECPTCDFVITVKAAMVNMNMDRPIPIKPK